MRSRLGVVPFLASAVAATTLLAACEGPTGPPGTANVISGRTTLAEADWSSDVVQFVLQTHEQTAVFSAAARYADVAVPELTADVVDNGAVLLYFTPDVSKPSLFSPLPYRFRWINSNPAYYWVYDGQVSEGNIRFLFFYEALDEGTTTPWPVDQFQHTRTYRWVIIPPAAASTVTALQVASGPDAVLDALRQQGFRVQDVGG